MRYDNTPATQPLSDDAMLDAEIVDNDDIDVYNILDDNSDDKDIPVIPIEPTTATTTGRYRRGDTPSRRSTDEVS